MKSYKVLIMHSVKLSVIFFFTLLALAFPFSISAQMACSFVPVSAALTDLGPNQYYRLSNVSPLTYVPTGIIGGLYPGGTNERPSGHLADGLSQSAQITPLNSSGSPSATGKIGLVSIGMSNTNSEFGTFMNLATGDSTINSKVVLVNGAAGGGVIERWIDPINWPTYWSNLDSQLANRNISDEQVQVVWVKVTQQRYQPNFPADMLLLSEKYKTLSQMLKEKFPNLKVTYFSSRIRSFSYLRGLSPEPSAFENAFAVRWLIEDQINGESEVNFKPELGPVHTSYITWGPYLWVDGSNPRSDGLTWPINFVEGDCTHPSNLGNQAVAQMLMNFFKTDATAAPWFLAAGTPIPTPTPTVTVTPTPVPSPTVTVTVTPSPTPVPSAGLVSSWGFANSAVTDDLNGCTGCSSTLATWFSPSIVSGGYEFNGTNSFLNLGSFPYLNNAPDFTIAFWLRPNFDQTHTTTRYAFSDGSNIQIFYLSNLNDWRATVRTTTGMYRLDTSGLVWNSGSWHHLALTYTGTVFRLYWDGQLVASLSAAGSVVGDSGATYLGRTAITGNYFLGAIDELQVYDSALSDSQISNLHSNP